VRRTEQHFNAAGARSQATMLMLAAIALILPAAFRVASGTTAEGLGKLSVSISVVLLFMYLLYLVFALMTHASLFAGSHTADEGGAGSSAWSVRTSGLVLAVATALIAWMSEILVGAIEPTAHEFGLSNVFVGVFVVAILGNAAEHATAISAALKDRMDLSLSIAIGSSVQVALGAGPGIRKSLHRSCSARPRVSGRPCPGGAALGPRHGPSCRRWTIRLAQGRAIARSLPRAWPHLLFHAG
jgi:Ca2+:H+ antiporter